MELEEASLIIEEISTGDKEREAYEIMKRCADVYRQLYEDAEKRISRYRDVSTKPDIMSFALNKDRHNTLEAAIRDYNGLDLEIKSKTSFDEWLFKCVS